MVVAVPLVRCSVLLIWIEQVDEVADTLTGMAAQSQPTWEQIIVAIERVGFPIVAYLLMFLGISAMILAAVRFFNQKLDQDRMTIANTMQGLTSQILDGQARIVDAQQDFNRMLIQQNRQQAEAMREMTKASESVAEGMRMTMLFLARTQSDVIATKSDVRSHREVVEGAESLGKD